MTTDRDHIEIDVLNDYVDDKLASTDRRRVAEHIDRCSRCRSEHERLVSMLRDATSLPESILPPEDLWSGIRESIDRRKEVVLPTTAASPASGRREAVDRPWWAYRSFVAAAAIVLVAVSSALTALVMDRTAGSTVAVNEAARSGVGDAHTPAVLPTSFRDAELGYLRSISELRAVLQNQKDVLRPETVATVENSLLVIDAAIDEARKALMADPGNETLVDLLKASYERKLDLLRRAADLGART